MMLLDEYVLGADVAQLVEQTKNGSIAWSLVSAAVVAAVRETVSGKKRITLTRARRPNRGVVVPTGEPDADLLFQVQALDVPGKPVELKIDTRRKPELYPVLELLFNSAIASVDVQSGRILKELVDHGVISADSEPQPSIGTGTRQSPKAA